MLKHALLTALLVTVASALGATLAQINERPQTLMAAYDGKDTAMKEIEEFKKRQAGHM
jgi:hypothetical protein